jgi:hypothetical protein
VRDAQPATGFVVVGADSAAIGTSSALPLIRLTAAHNARR